MALLPGCQPSASSPLELVEQPDASNSDVRCLAEDYPILFHSTRGSQALESQLFLMRADGSEVRRIDQSGNYYGAVWSPDGRSIAVRRRGLMTGSADSASEIGLVSADGTQRISLFADESPRAVSVFYHGLDGPTWSPDGRSLAFGSRDEAGMWAVWIMSSSGGQHHRLMPDLAHAHADPSFAQHDAARLAYVAAVDDVQDIWSVELTEPMQHENLTRGRVLLPHAPRWSPDGQRLAFSATPLESGDIEEVYVFDFSRSELVRLTNDDRVAMGPAWSPDGSSLLIGSTRRSAEDAAASGIDLWQVWLDGSRALLQLTRGQGANFGPDWYRSTACGTR